LGLRNRFRLARLLRREGLPPFGRLANWVCILQLLWEAEAANTPLLQLARRAQIDPTMCYRCCKRTLGVPWSSARDRGFAWALLEFLGDCRHPARRFSRGRSQRTAPRPRNRRQHDSVREDHNDAGAVTLLDSVSRSVHASAQHPLGRLAARVPLPNAPTDVAISRSGVVFVTRAYAATIERIELRTLKTTASIPVGCNPTRLVFDRTGRRAYVTNQFSDSISVIDVGGNRLIDDIQVAGDPAPVIVAPDEQTLYVTTNLDSLFVINLANQRLLADISLPATSHHLIMHPSGKRLYVATRAGGTVLEIDTHTYRVQRTFAVGGQTQGLAVSGDGKELYVSNESGELDVMNLQTGTLVSSRRLDGEAYGLALSPDDAHLYVGLISTGRVEVLERETLRTVHVIHTGGAPREIAFDHSGRTALIANEHGWVDIVN
jgi:YVTN family beta-propeller protein